MLALLALGLLGCHATSAAEDLLTDGVVEFRAAYRVWDAAGLGRAADLLGRATEQAPASVTAHYWLGVTEFHRVLHLAGERGSASRRRQAGGSLERAVAALTRAIELAPDHGESRALLSSVYGLSIGANPLRAFRLGPRMMDQERRARASSPDNPRVLCLLGLNRFYGPAVLGGKPEGLELLLAAEQRFAVEARSAAADPLAPRWGYSTCLVYVGKTYDALGQPADAEEYVRKALELDPEHALARTELEKRKK